MPWVRAQLRGTPVLARSNAEGSLEVRRGLVEICYRAPDGKRYRARPANLSVVGTATLPDDFCGEAQEGVSAACAQGSAEQPGETHTTLADGATLGEGCALAARVVEPEQQHARSARWEAWTDGACQGNPGPSGLGLVLMRSGERTEAWEYLGEGTNNIAELTAIRRALERVPREAAMTIHTDSQYSIGVLQKGWKAKANQQLIAVIKQELAARPWVRLVYAPGHAGVPLNERADQLARMAVSTGGSGEATHRDSRAKRGVGGGRSEGI